MTRNLSHAQWNLGPNSWNLFRIKICCSLSNKIFPSWIFESGIDVRNASPSWTDHSLCSLFSQKNYEPFFQTNSLWCELPRNSDNLFPSSPSWRILISTTQGNCPHCSKVDDTSASKVSLDFWLWSSSLASKVARSHNSRLLVMRISERQGLLERIPKYCIADLKGTLKEEALFSHQRYYVLSLQRTWFTCVTVWSDAYRSSTELPRSQLLWISLRLIFIAVGLEGTGCPGKCARNFIWQRTTDLDTEKISRIRP